MVVVEDRGCLQDMAADDLQLERMRTKSREDRLQEMEEELAVEKHAKATTKKQISQKRCNAQTKSSPSKYVQVLDILIKDQRQIIKDLGFGELLKFKLTYQSIYIIEFLLDSTDPKSLVTCVGGKDRSLHIDQNAVHCVLGVPTGRGDDLPHYEDENSELNKLKSELGLTKDSKITYDMLREKIEKGGTDDLTIRCFFLVLFSTLLFPGTQLFITGRQAAMTRSTDELKTINWAKVVVDDIRAAVNKWRTRGSTEERSSICCCATFMMFRSVNNSCYSIATGEDRLREMEEELAVEKAHTTAAPGELLGSDPAQYGAAFGRVAECLGKLHDTLGAWSLNAGRAIAADVTEYLLACCLSRDPAFRQETVLEGIMCADDSEEASLRERVRDVAQRFANENPVMAVMAPVAQDDDEGGVEA
ncbi:hypothetical protein BAE44_0025828 [Dichanthelium oligosanthes]|uniref:Uncharacterized protein n=1 Tax=Dichanthelium oligosanthes TaxID=888268 RepID=A0A1E5UJV2_9POAL|nr:hypothetical protein BAE44_0025828 [Dichanthelium oligosanthes]